MRADVVDAGPLLLCLVDGRELVGLASVAQDRHPGGDPHPDGVEPIPSRLPGGALQGSGLPLTTAPGGLLLLRHVHDSTDPHPRRPSNIDMGFPPAHPPRPKVEGWRTVIYPNPDY